MPNTFSSAFGAGFESGLFWARIRSRIAAVLAGVSISDPINETMARVYKSPPENYDAMNMPCCVMNGAALEVKRRSSLRTKFYTINIDLLVVNEDQQNAFLIAEAYREAIIDAFDADVTLNGNVSAVTSGPTFPAPQDAVVNGARAVGMPMTLTLTVSEGVTYGP